MIIKFKNKEIVGIYGFLSKLSLKSKKSRARTRLQRKLEEKYKEYAEGKVEIQKTYALCDEKGELVLGKDDDLKFETPARKRAYLKEVEELDEEYAVIDYKEIMQQLNVLYKVLDKIEMELEGGDATAYDVLCEQLEKLPEEEEEGE